MSKVVELTEDTAKDFIKLADIAVVKGWMDNCSYCDEFAPIFEGVADELTDVSLVFGSLKIATTGPSEFRRNYMKTKPGEPNGAPCTFIFKKGEFVTRHHGRITKEQLKEFIKTERIDSLPPRVKQPHEFSVVELKAAWLDQLLQIEQCQKNIQEIQAEIAKRG